MFHLDETTEQDERRASITAASIVAFFYGCGLHLGKLPATPPHRTSDAQAAIPSHGARPNRTLLFDASGASAIGGIRRLADLTPKKCHIS